jgi:hypothetical protein|tara:strand:+ start:1569 stop:1925 length:357 start_codon:yes stop_codon:yes gene_type:complete
MTKIFAQLIYNTFILLLNFLSFGKLFFVEAVLIKLNSCLRTFVALTKNKLDDEAQKIFETLVVNNCVSLIKKEKDALKRKMIIDKINQEKGNLLNLKLIYKPEELIINNNALKKKVKL